MSTTMISFILCLVLAFLCGLVLIPFLKKIKAGQSIREDGPTWHMSKQGTPTMGGLIFMIPVTIAAVTVGMPGIMRGDFSGLVILGLALVFGAIGFIDDFFKVVKKRNLGLTALQKFLLQMVLGALFLIIIRATGHLSGEVIIPFTSIRFPLPWVVYVVIALIYMVGFVNAVNITDGIDGLVTGVTIPVCATFAGVFLLLKGLDNTGAILCAGLAGALIGFLFFNFHPAKVFMGDTGSHFLGGALVGMAFVCDVPLLLIPLGLIYLIEMFSVIIQVIYFKSTHGKRLFRMSPIHHHFEMGGWSEIKLFTVFTLISVVCCIVTYLFAVLPMVY